MHRSHEMIPVFYSAIIFNKSNQNQAERCNLQLFINSLFNVPNVTVVSQ